MTSLFISYSHKDSEFAHKLIEAFKSRDLDFWIDWKGIPPTVDWWREIEKGIEEANIFIFLLSPDSAGSEVCKREIGHAARNGKRLIPLVVRDIKAKEAPGELAHLNWLFFRQGDDFPSSFEKLVTAIQTDYQWTEIHRRLQVRALEWERGGRDNSFLLRGRDLEDAQAQLVRNSGKNPNTTELQAEYVLTSRQASDRQRRTITGSAVAGLILMAVLAAFGFVQANLARTAEAQADERAVLARAGELAAQAISQRSQDFTVSLLLGMEAYLTRDTVQTRAAILDNVYANPAIRAYLRRHTGRVSSLAFSPDGKSLASGGPGDGGVLLWDIEDGQFPVQTLPMPGNSLAFSPDGSSLAGSGPDQIAVWQLDSDTPKHRFTIDGDFSAQEILFDPGGKTLLSAGTGSAVRVWDAMTGQLHSQPLGEQPQDTANPDMLFSPDGKIIAQGSPGSVALWDMDTGEHVELPAGVGQDGVTGTAGSLAFHPDGRVLAVSSGNRVTLWDVNTLSALGDPIEAPSTDIRGYDSQVSTVAFTPDGNMLATGSEDGTIILWDVSAASDTAGNAGYTASYTLTGQVSGLYGPVTSFAFRPGGKTMAAGYDDGTILLLDLERMRGRSAGLPEQIGQSLIQSDTYANSVAFSRDGSKLAAGFGDGTVQIWDLGRDQPLTGSRTRQKSGVLALAFSPDPEGKTIAAAGQEVILLDGRTGQATRQPLDGQQGQVTSISFHPDGSILASSGSGTLILWDLEAGEALAPLPETREIQTVAFSPDGKVLAAGSADGYLQLWDLEKKGLIADLDTNGDAIFSIAFSPDGKWVAAGNADSTIFLGDGESGQQAGPPLDRHTGIVNQVAFSPDGTMLASGSMDGTILLWDVQTGQAVGQPLDADSSGVNSIAFSPDGKTLASASGNFDHSRIILWDVDIASWLQKTCRRAGRNFTAGEWERFFPGEPYRKTCAEFQKDPAYYQARAGDLLSAQDKPLDLQQAIEDLEAEMKLDTAIEQPSWKARQIITQIVENQITDEAYNGSFLKALDLMDQVQENDLALDPQLLDASLFNRLCWDGSVSGAVRQVMEYCEQAVALAPEDPDVRDSRGLARALMKDTSGAIKDFQFFIENSEEVDLIQQRQAWIDELKAGRSPFTPGVLEQLRD